MRISRTSEDQERVDVDYDEIRQRTKLAVLIYDGTSETWLPLSQIHIHAKTVSVPVWLAKEKGLI